MLPLQLKVYSSLSQRQLLDFLRQLVPKEHWNNFNENALQLDNDELIINEVDTRLMIKQVMDNCNGVLDFYGPVEYLLWDVKTLFGVHSLYGTHYKCLYPFAAVSKQDLFFSFVSSYFSTVDSFDSKVARLLQESLCARMERQLAGVHEMVPIYWFDILSRDQKLLSSLGIGGFKSQKSMKMSTARLESHAALINFIVSEFSTFLDGAHNKHLIVRLRKYLMDYLNMKKCGVFVTNVVLNELCTLLNSMDIVKNTILEFIDKHPYQFLPFAESQKVMGADFPVEPPVIRLITLGDEKILFAKDVENAVRRAMKNLGRAAEIPKGILSVETEEDLQNGIYLTISYPDYLKVLEKLQLDPDCITLFNLGISHSRHLAAPIYSSYGTKCKPVADVFNELMSILTIEFQFWQRIQFAKGDQFMGKIEKICATFMDPTRICYFVECSRIEKLAEQLRAGLIPLLTSLPKTSRFPQQLFYDQFAKLTPFLLKNSVQLMQREDLRGTRSRREERIPLIYAKHCVLKQVPIFTQLKLLAAVQECLTGGLVESIPWINKFMCSQKQCHPFSAFSCVCPPTEVVPEFSVGCEKAVYTEEDDYSMKFESFGISNSNIFYLVNKKTGENLVLGEQWMFFASLLLDIIDDEYAKLLDNAINMDAGTLTEISNLPYYITAAEMDQLIKGPVRAFEEFYKGAIRTLKEKEREGPAVFAEVQDKFFKALYSHIWDCIASFYQCAVDNRALEDSLPNHVFHVIATRRNDEHGSNFCAIYGTVIHALALLLNQNKAMVTGKHWHLFDKLVLRSVDDGGWTLVAVKKFIHELRAFPINPGRFHFVPETNLVFWNFTRKASEVIAEVRAEERRQYREEQKALEKKLKQEKKMAKAAEKEEKKQKKKAEKLERRAAIEEPDVAEPEQENAEEPENLLVELRKKMEEFDELTMKLRDSDEKREKLKKAEADRKKELGQMKQQMSAKEKTNQELQQEIEKSRKKHSQLASAKGREIQEMKRRFEREAAEKKTQYDKLQNENRALHEALRIGKLREEAIEKECAEKIKEILATAGNFDQLRADFARVFDDNNRLASQNQFYMNMLQGNFESVRRLHEEQCAQLQFFSSQASLATPMFSPATPSSSESSSVAVSDAFSLQQHEFVQNLHPRQRNPLTIAAPAPPPPECGICLSSMTSTSETITCEVCTTKRHAPCIEEWLTKKATCPVCNRSLPSPSHFPPIQ